MSPRSIRRAAERKALKLARKAERTGEARLALAGEPGETTISPAQLAANRANAGLSTGPKTAEGKAKVSLNAVKTGLTGRTVLLPTDDVAEYEHHVRMCEKEFNPVGPRECELVQSIADTMWRLRRIPGLEMAIYALGRVQFANRFDDHDPALRPAMIDLHTFLAYEKQLRNLQLQEARLARRREKEISELRKLQEDRKAVEQETLARAAKLYAAARQERRAFNPQENGFEFSIDEIERHLDEIRTSRVRCDTPVKAPNSAIGDEITSSQAA